MTYRRTIPRDLFNEANLLKCYGRIYINLENMARCDASLTDTDGTESFVVMQNDATGGIFLANVHLIVRGERYQLERPLNSREAWPLYLTTSDDDEIEVFNDDGEFSPEMIEFLTATE